MKVVIIDNENRTRNLIRKMIGSFNLNLTFNSVGYDLKSGLQVIEKEEPDIVLIDLQISNDSSFDVLNLLKNKRVKVICITESEEFAIKAIQFFAFDYILKPLEEIHVEKALSKAIREMKEANQFTINQEQYIALTENISPQKKQRLVLKTQESIYVVDLKDIIRCEADRNYTSFFLQNKTKILVSKTLKEYDLLLSSHNFLRVQQSHLINLDYVERYDKGPIGTIVMKDGSQVPLSQSKKEIFFLTLEQL